MTNRRKDIPEESLRRLYEEGLSPRAIGQRLGVGETAIRKRLIALDIPLHSRAEGIRLARGINVSREELERLYYVEGLSQSQIARRLECGEDAVRDAMRRYGLKTRSPSESARLARGVQIAEEELRRLYQEERLSTRAIAERHGCSESAVRNRMDEYGIQRRTPWAKQEVDIGEETLRRLYLDEGLTVEEIAERYHCGISTISRQLKRYGIPARPFSEPLHPRADFSGDPLEKAYLVGFRLGDLTFREENLTIVMSTTTTKQAQLDLLHRLFDRYGNVNEFHDRSGRIYVRCRLNQSFLFLLPKEDAVPEWILADDEVFLAFLAGYADAEGSFRTAPIFVLRTYDTGLLRACWSRLQQIGIQCPPPRIAVKAGYVNKAGVISRKDQWDLAVHRQGALRRLIVLLLPYMRHAKRRNDAMKVLQVIGG